MKIEKKHKSTFIFLSLFIIIGFFRFNKCQANQNIFLNEILINGTNKEEFIELYNPTSQEIKLKNYYLVYYSSKRNWNKPYKKNVFPKKSAIKPSNFFLIAMKGGLPKSVHSDWSLNYHLSNSNGSVALFPNNTFEKNNCLNLLAWGKVFAVGKGQELKSSKTGQSFERTTVTKNKWQKSYILNGTPGYKNSTQPILKNYTHKIKINEIYPSPNTHIGETEFIEIKNISKENINLKNWSASDSIHKGKLLKKSYILQPNAFYVFQGKFYLNSSNDSANVFDENKKLVASLSYKKGKSRYSYAFDGSTWRWTSQLTPGEKNKFDKILSGKIIKDKPIYKNIYANFKVKSNKDVQKFTWNFGDGHKSYLKNTHHKYKKTGKYKVSLKITGKGESSFYNFIIKVRKYKALKVRIKILFPNPKGNDFKNEWLSIKNESKKNINLKNWSIATGWKKLSNHPIRKDFKIKSGKIKILTHNVCAFTLNNTKAKIELRDPSGKIIQKIRYRQNKAVPENSFYQKINYHWKWFFPQKKSSSQTLKKVAGASTTKFLSFISHSSLIKKPLFSKKIFLLSSTPFSSSSHAKIKDLPKKTSPFISLISPKKKINSQLMLPNIVSPLKITTRFFQKSKQPIHLFLISNNSFSSTHPKIIFYSFTKKISSEYWLIKFTRHFNHFLNSRLNQLFWQL